VRRGENEKERLINNIGFVTLSSLSSLKSLKSLNKLIFSSGLHRIHFPEFMTYFVTRELK